MDEASFLILATIAVAWAVGFVLWFFFFESPRRQERERRRERWLTRQREESLGLWYGDDHRALRRQYQKKVDSGEAHCMERICVMPTRQIAPGAFWHLAHDHVKGGPLDYLGPAHPECNEAEAKTRGVRFESTHRPSPRDSQPNHKDSWATEVPRSRGQDEGNTWWMREPPQEDPWGESPSSTSGDRASDNPWGTDDSPPF
jgi:hypothetical protein